MIASLPMYDLPEVSPATDEWWSGIARALRREGVRSVPETLSRGGPMDEVWRASNLLLSQTCGYPLTHDLAGVVKPVITPAYAAHGCRGAEYCSLIIVSESNPTTRLEDLRDSVGVINSRRSQSGYNILRATLAPLAGGDAFFSRVIVSGGHLASIELVAGGQADVCAVDCVTHAMFARHRPDALAGTRVLTETERAPGLPYVARLGIDGDEMQRLRAALRAAFSDPSLAGAREALLLEGMEVLETADYQRIVDMERSAQAAGYPDVH